MLSRKDALEWLRAECRVDDPAATFFSGYHSDEASRAKIGPMRVASWWVNIPVPVVVQPERDFIHLALARPRLGGFAWLRIPTCFLIDEMDADRLQIDDADRIHLWLCAEPGRWYLRELKHPDARVDFSEFEMNPADEG